jgi:hypothetical protein
MKIGRGRRTGRRLAMIAGVLPVLLAACGTPGYQYIRNTSTRSAFKIPTGWTTFDKATYLGLPSGPQPSAPDPIRWLVALDGSPSPSVSHIVNSSDLATTYPQGLALVYHLNPVTRDSVSLQKLRNFLFPVDFFQNPDDIQFLSYNDSVLLDQNRVHGVKLSYQFRENALPDAISASQQQQGESTGGPPAPGASLVGGSFSSGLGPTFVHVDQVAYLDANSQNVYFLALLCSATCFDRNHAAIETAVSSWTVLP